MLVVLTFFLVIASSILVVVKKNKESLLLFGLCVSLSLEMCGVMIFIAKKGGISQDVALFLFLSRLIQEKLRYLWITLQQLGCLIALGRTLYPFFLLEIGLSYSMLPWIRKNTWFKKAAMILPALTLLFYYPAFYSRFLIKNIFWQEMLATVSFGWITIYLLLSLGLLFIEYRSITMKFCKRQFALIAICLTMLTIIYVIYYHQDPGQVYAFYSYRFLWGHGIGYLQINPSVKSYVVLIFLSSICSIMGFYNLLRYTTEGVQDNREEMVMRRKFDMAKVGVSMFVHGMKNQLLSTKVIYKRIDQLYKQPQIDVEKLKEYIDSLESFNNAMLERVTELYGSVRVNAITMTPITIEEIFSTSLERCKKKYPDLEVITEFSEEIVIMADKNHLCEALYNLLINAYEASQGEQNMGKSVFLRCYHERLYTVIEVRDQGKGMSKTEIKKVFEPFYSNKNSNYNWGMGLYYVRETVKGHLGTVKIESKPNKGSSFFVLLPRYK